MGSFPAAKRDVEILPDLSPKVCDQSHLMHHTLRSATRKKPPGGVHARPVVRAATSEFSLAIDAD
jgi:hypothetical protein